MSSIEPSDGQLLAVLQSTFGHHEFRPHQEEIIRSILRGQDVFALMPTGGGKSLCYQLPALLLDGPTVVVSPLIALMKDQVDALQARGVAATFVNSSLDPAEAARRQASLARGEIKLLYVAPERLMLPGFLRLLSTLPVACFVVDEAHCISEWGHDFRPDYRQLTHLREHFPMTTLAAFTATATGRVQADILLQLGLKQPASFRGSLNRSNLFYEVRPKQRAYQQLVTYLRGKGGDAGIIYCQSRRATEALAADLCVDGFRAAAYHAGLLDEDRRKRQEAFIGNSMQIIVATIAFGMGIDKPNVRFVIHYDLPKNIEGYYQESGRAGRDGEPSECILFYSYGDVAKQEYFIRQKESLKERQIAFQQLQQMTSWAEAMSCRRQNLLAYFDEPFSGQPDPCCDVCGEPGVMVDCTTLVQLLLACLQQTGERYGLTHAIRVLVGSRDVRILRARHDSLPIHGAGRDRTRPEWRQLAQGLIQQGYIRLEGDFQVVKLTEHGRAALTGKERVLLPAPAGGAQQAPAPPRTTTQAIEPAPAVEFHEALFEQLRHVRLHLAQERRVAPFVILHDKTLRQMAAELPTHRDTLQRIPYIGERKALDFGDAFLECIRQYIQQSGAQPSLPSPPPSDPTNSNYRTPQPRATESAKPDHDTRAARVSLDSKPTKTLHASARMNLDLFQKGHSVEQIAVQRGQSPRTVEQHLVEAITAGETVDLSRLLTQDKRRAIEAAIAEVGDERFKPLMEHLGDGFTYAEIRYVRAVHRYIHQTGARLLSSSSPSLHPTYNSYRNQQPHDIEPGRPDQDVGTTQGPLGPRPTKKLHESARVTLRLFQEGCIVEQIAVQRGLSRITIEQHLIDAIAAGEEVDLSSLLTVKKRRAIEAAIAEAGSERLEPVMERLGEGYTYAEVLYIMALHRCADSQLH